MADKKNFNILVVDNDEINRKNISLVLGREGYDIDSAKNGSETLSRLNTSTYHLVFLSDVLEDLDSIELMTAAKAIQPDMEVIFISGSSSVENAVSAMMAGAFSFLRRPVDIGQLLELVENALSKSRIRQEIRRQSRDLRASRGIQFIGKTPVITRLKSDIAEIAQRDSNVLILGETGTGKELVASTIHALSPRSNKRFLPINCSALTEELMLNELFGHEKEAFTGASKFRTGLFEAADGGTILLDEIGEMPVSMQVKLLRVLQEKKIIRVGGTREIPVDVRILAATNRNLKEEVKSGRFRQDLFYRINVVTLEIPPLRARRDDIPLLIQHFLAKYPTPDNRINTISAEALDILMSYDYPGNVRELENIIERAQAMCREEEIRKHHLPLELQGNRAAPGGREGGCIQFKTLKEHERDYIMSVLDHVNGNRTRAARILGIDRVSLWRKLKKYSDNKGG